MIESNEKTEETSSPASVPVELVILIPAERIRFSDEPNRDESAFTDESFERLMESIDVTKGNTQHVLVQEVAGIDGEVVYDLISGHRRVRACQRTGWPVRAIVTKALDARSALLKRIAENTHRKDLSPHERGRQIEQGFQRQLFAFESEAARMIGVDKSDLNKMRKLGRLDPVIVAAFACPNELQFRHAKPLTDAAAANPKAVLAEAARVAALDPRLPADQVVELLVAAASGKGVGPSHTPNRDLPLECDGRAVGQIKVAKDGTVKIELDVPLERKEREMLTKTLEAFVRKRVLKLAPAALKVPQVQP